MDIKKVVTAGVNHATMRTSKAPFFTGGGRQSHRRFTSLCSLLFKRMHKGVCLMIYHLMPQWKSKWILESAQLLNPEEECVIYESHIRSLVCSTVCLSKHVWTGILAPLGTCHEMLCSRLLYACLIMLFNWIADTYPSNSSYANLFHDGVA